MPDGEAMSAGTPTSRGLGNSDTFFAAFRGEVIHVDLMMHPTTAYVGKLVAVYDDSLIIERTTDAVQMLVYKHAIAAMYPVKNPAALPMR